jgi:hypothetical protein
VGKTAISSCGNEITVVRTHKENSMQLVLDVDSLDYIIK